MTSLNEAISRMPTDLGQMVLNCKANVSHDCDSAVEDICPMEKDGKSSFKMRFIARVRAAREDHGTTQEEIAVLLGVDQDKYKHYEKRSFLPHDLIPKFLSVTRVDWAWLFTEKGRGPSVSAVDAEVENISKTRGKRKLRRKAA